MRAATFFPVVCLCLGLLIYAGEGAEGQSGPVADRGVSVIVNADDVGAHPVFTDASLAALASGRISSASIIVTGSDAGRAFALFRRHPEYDIGVHLCLNGDTKPLTARERAPSLYSPRGTMWATNTEVAANVLPHEAQLEWDAQVRTALDAGVRVTHLDAHMGCYFQTQALFAAALAVARKYRIPLITPYLPPASAGSFDFRAVASYTGIYLIDGKAESLKNRIEAYRKLLGGLNPGVHYLYTHQGMAPGNGESFGDLDLRIDESLFWTTVRSTALLRELGIRLIRCSALR